MKVVSAVLFDLYDTLIRLSRDGYPYMQLCRKTSCRSRLRDSMIVEAPTLLDFCAYLDVKPPDDISKLQAVLEADIRSAVTFPDAVSTLRALKEKNIRIAVVSNVATPYKSAFYNLGLDQFVDVAIFSCEVGIAKPDRGIYEAALSSLGIDGRDTIMIGDSLRSDVVGPSASGIRGILIDRRKDSSNEDAINSLKGVERLLF